MEIKKMISLVFSKIPMEQKYHTRIFLRDLKNYSIQASELKLDYYKDNEEKKHETNIILILNRENKKKKNKS